MTQVVHMGSVVASEVNTGNEGGRREAEERGVARGRGVVGVLSESRDQKK